MKVTIKIKIKFVEVFWTLSSMIFQNENFTFDFTQNKNKNVTK